MCVCVRERERERERVRKNFKNEENFDLSLYQKHFNFFVALKIILVGNSISEDSVLKILCWCARWILVHINIWPRWPVWVFFLLFFLMPYLSCLAEYINQTQYLRLLKSRDWGKVHIKFVSCPLVTIILNAPLFGLTGYKKIDCLVVLNCYEKFSR